MNRELSKEEKEYRDVAQEQLKDDYLFYLTLSMALEHYAALMHFPPLELDKDPGCRDPLRAQVLREEVFRRSEFLKPRKEKN